MLKALFTIIFFTILSVHFVAFGVSDVHAQCPPETIHGQPQCAATLPSGSSGGLYYPNCDSYCGSAQQCYIFGPYNTSLYTVGEKYALRHDTICNKGALSCLGKACYWDTMYVEISCSGGNVYKLYQDSNTFSISSGEIVACSAETSSQCSAQSVGNWSYCSSLNSWNDESLQCGDACGGGNTCPAGCNMCDALSGCAAPPTSTPIPTDTPEFTPTPTDTPIPTPTSEWECPQGYNQECVVSGGSCSEMRIARCGICGGLNDCCCTSVVPGGQCPNGTCGADESCRTCEADCGACPLPPTPTLPPDAPTPPPVMRTITGKLFIDSGGTTAQQDVGESCYDQPVSVRIEDVRNPALVYNTTATVVAGCATYTQQVQDGHTYRITISGLTGYQVTGWNNGCNPNTPGCSSTTLPAQITVN